MPPSLLVHPRTSGLSHTRPPRKPRPPRLRKTRLPRAPTAQKPAVQNLDACRPQAPVSRMSKAPTALRFRPRPISASAIPQKSPLPVERNRRQTGTGTSKSKRLPRLLPSFLREHIPRHVDRFPPLPSLHLFFRLQYTAEPVTEHRFVFHVERLFEDQPVAVESHLLATAVEMEQLL